MHNDKTFRPRGNFAWAIVALTIDVIFIGQLVFYPTDNRFAFVDFSIAVVLAILACLLWVRPKLVLRETDLVVVNPLSSKTIAYQDIVELETKWSLLIIHKHGTTRVWVAPANGKNRWIATSAGSWGTSSRIPVAKDQPGETSMSQSLNSDSGIAAALIRERLRGLH